MFSFFLPHPRPLPILGRGGVVDSDCPNAYIGVVRMQAFGLSQRLHTFFTVKEVLKSGKFGGSRLRRNDKELSFLRRGNLLLHDKCTVPVLRFYLNFHRIVHPLIRLYKKVFNFEIDVAACYAVLQFNCNGMCAVGYNGIVAKIH